MRLAAAWLGENGVMGLWRLLAAVLVVGLSVLFAVLFTHRAVAFGTCFAIDSRH